MKIQWFDLLTPEGRDRAGSLPIDSTLEDLPLWPEAMDALQEEFSELEELVKRMQEIGRTPINANDLPGFQENVKLAREVGLVLVYEGTEEEVQRYKVPEIYRIAMGLTRKGQA